MNILFYTNNIYDRCMVIKYTVTLLHFCKVKSKTAMIVLITVFYPI